MGKRETVHDATLTLILDALPDHKRAAEVMELQLELLAISITAYARGKDRAASELCEAVSADLFKRVTGEIAGLKRYLAEKDT